MREFKQGIIAREAVQMTQMARQWLSVEQALQGHIELTAQRAMELKAQGVTVNQWRLREMERYKALHAQTVAQFNRYASYADGYISDL